MELNKPVFSCDLCPKNFEHKRSLLRHQSSNHNRKVDRQKCALCDCEITNIDFYSDHLSKAHQISVVIEDKTFESLHDFSEWKSQIEKETSSFYTKQNGSSCTWYYCNRSGTFESKGQGLRHKKIQGTRKIGAKCPSSMRVKIGKTQIDVRWWKTHVGHMTELKHINIPSADRNELASYLALGLSKNKILENIRASWSEDDYYRVHLTTNKDLTNIARDKNINCNVFRHSNDLVSVESWIEEMKSTETDPILHYELEERKNFVLVIATKGQRFLFQKYGSNIIAIDSTHGTNVYGFQLTTIMIVDENRVGFPVSYMYSTSVDTSTLVTYFNALKSSCVIPKPRTFMSDDYPAFYDAWLEVFEKPDNHLICSWHVLRNWNKHLHQVKDIELQSKLRADLFRIQRELDLNQFNRLLTFFYDSYGSCPGASEFLKYFKAHYANRTQLWAACFRQNLGINTNMYLESLHRSLKYVYMQGRKIRRMDESISILMKLTYNMQQERLIRKEKGYVPKKLEDLRSRHRLSLQCNFKTARDDAEGNLFTIISEKANESLIYQVILSDDRGLCDCLLKCVECNLCLHEATCDCYDHAIKGQMCKHIHYIGRMYAVEISVDIANAEHDEPPLIIATNEADGALDEEREHLLSSSQKNESNELANLKRKIRDQVEQALNMCTSVKQVKALQTFVSAMEPTIRAAEISDGAIISEVSGSQEKGRKIDKQRRFWKKKKKSKRTSFEPSRIDFELLQHDLEKSHNKYSDYQSIEQVERGNAGELEINE